MTDLKLFNSLTREVEAFQPIHKGEARVYTCGPTVYNYPHIGNMRAYVFADTLGRALSFKGHTLKHVINITDVGHLTDDGDAGEDKMEKMAAEKAQSIWDIAKHYTQAYWADIKALNIREPMKWSIATEYVPAMIEFAQSIADKHCYELDHGLYFDVSTVEDYGRLARAKTEEGEGRIESVEGKRNAADFAIWRKTPAGETRQMEWDSPWGKGAPGWHLECSVMSKELLGFPFDIHTGGIDHREIHHANEIAQNQAIEGCGGLTGNDGCAEHSGANIWMHNNFLIDRAGKMSKSSGEFLRIQLLIDKGFHPLAYRMMCLQAHYRSELEFSWENLAAAFTRMKRLVMGIANLKARHAEAVSASTANKEIKAGRKLALDDVQGDLIEKLKPLLEKFDFAIADDLNTSVALTILEDTIAIKKTDIGQKLLLIAAMDAVLGLDLLRIGRGDLRVRPKLAMLTEEEIEAQISARKGARANKNFEASDNIRDALTAKGVDVMDGDPLGWDWKLDV